LEEETMRRAWRRVSVASVGLEEEERTRRRRRWSASKAGRRIAFGAAREGKGDGISGQAAIGVNGATQIGLVITQV